MSIRGWAKVSFGGGGDCPRPPPTDGLLHPVSKCNPYRYGSGGMGWRKNAEKWVIRVIVCNNSGFHISYELIVFLEIW